MTPEQFAKSGSEHGQQVALFVWAQQMWTREPLLKLMFAIPNGGMRDKITAANLKAEGVKPGVPDIMLPVPRKIYAGLFIEMKKPGKYTVSPAQVQWREDLTAQHYYAALCVGWEQAKECIEWYLDMNVGVN